MIKLEKKGVIFNKSNTKKLEYEKKGGNFSIAIFDCKNENKPSGNKTVYSRINSFNILMNEKTLLNYLQTELYL